MTTRADTGLRRFVGGRSQAAEASTAQPNPAEQQPEPERCELCDTPVDSRHGHVVDREHQRLMCTCRACYLLFTHERSTSPDGADAQPAVRYRAVPDRYLHDPERQLTQADWERLQVPVGAAFFIRGVGDRPVAGFYPSPAGATECLLDLAAWSELGERHPLLNAAEAEVEAILIRRSESGIDCFLVPVDACYELVGAMRLLWRGFDGGAEARTRIDEFFDTVRTRARPFAAGS